MSVSNPFDDLKKIGTRLAGRGAAVEYLGSGATRFVSAMLGERGAEIYPHGDSWIVDPSLDRDLLGEVVFVDRTAAVEAVWDWLSEGKRPLPDERSVAPSKR